MATSFALDTLVGEMSPEELRSTLSAFVPAGTDKARVDTIEAILNGPSGYMIRTAMARWVSEHIVPASRLVPAAHVRWIPVVRDAMVFVVMHLSAARLAPKLLEQLELPNRTRPETRLLLLISKVPGLQKLGQVLARNRHLGPSLRRALVRLENDIRDVKPQEVSVLIRQRLGRRIDDFDIRFRSAILSEASVSAIVRFTWRNPDSGDRERGVFKILKPYIPTFFAEDMKILQGLAEHFGSRLDDYGLSGDVLSDTFTKVRRLLEHEVDFVGEQKTLSRAYELYRSMSAVRVPRVIKPLCGTEITAMSEERGTKITLATKQMSPWKRARLAEKLVEAMVALPLLAADENALFHADPHAGNLFYDRSKGQIVILDWALTERLTREQRRHLALLFGYVALRDSVAVAREIEALRQAGRAQKPSHLVRDQVNAFISALPLARLPNAVDAMRLVERLAMNGSKFPAPLIMLSKVLLTLDGVLGDLGAGENCMGIGIARHFLRQSVMNRNVIASPLRLRDWMALQTSALFYLGRVWIRWEELLAASLFADTRTAVQPAPS